MKYVNKLWIMLLAFPILVAANPEKKKWDYEKTKNIRKEFNVNADALLRIQNKYGNLEVVSWSENRVVVEVTITVSGDKESRVVSRLDKIDVKFEANASEVSAKTILGDNSGNWFGKGENMSIQIDYKVKMPITNRADFSNDYGTISLNELKGRANISCDYGKVLLGSLHHAENSIHTDYSSNSVIEFMNAGTINADYSKLNVVKANRIKLDADYTETAFEKVGELNFSCDYGEIKVDDAGSVEGSGDYLNMRFGTIRNKLVVDADYGDIRVEELVKGFKTLSVTSDYAGMKIGLGSEVSFDFDVELSYGGFTYDGDNINYVRKIEKNTSKQFEGFVNQQNSGSNLQIKSAYGSVKLFNK